MTELRVLLVGAGWAAHRHAEAIEQSGDRISVLVEPDAARRTSLGQQLGSELRAGLTEWEADGPEVDAAVLASPSSEHLRQTLALVRADVPVLVEKPHRLPGEDASELLDAVQGRHVPVQIGMTTRYSGGLPALRHALASGQLGEPVWVTDRIWSQLSAGQLSPWYFDPRASGGGVLLTNGVHALDRVSWLLGEPLELGSAQLCTLTPGREVEDAAMLQLHTPGGVGVVVSLLWAPFAVPASELRIVASRGTAVVRADGSWHTALAGRPESGGEAEPQSAAFSRQWEVFRTRVLDRGPAGPGLLAGELALATIEAAYATQAPAWLS